MSYALRICEMVCTQFTFQFRYIFPQDWVRLLNLQKLKWKVFFIYENTNYLWF